jgi:hypothetical protein
MESYELHNLIVTRVVVYYIFYLVVFLTYLLVGSPLQLGLSSVALFRYKAPSLKPPPLLQELHTSPLSPSSPLILPLPRS